MVYLMWLLRVIAFISSRFISLRLVFLQDSSCQRYFTLPHQNVYWFRTKSSRSSPRSLWKASKIFMTFFSKAYKFSLKDSFYYHSPYSNIKDLNDNCYNKNCNGIDKNKWDFGTSVIVLIHNMLQYEFLVSNNLFLDICPVFFNHCSSNTADNLSSNDQL